MSERDRLAADLHAVIRETWHSDGEAAWERGLADSLIERGWTRREPPAKHADQCALAPDHGGPCMWVGGRRPDDPVFPNAGRMHDAEVRMDSYVEGVALGLEVGEITEERLARALATVYGKGTVIEWDRADAAAILAALREDER